MKEETRFRNDAEMRKYFQRKLQRLKISKECATTEEKRCDYARRIQSMERMLRFMDRHFGGTVQRAEGGEFRITADRGSRRNEV